MTPDKSIREIRNSLAIGACVLVGALVLCSLVGCGESELDKSMARLEASVEAYRKTVASNVEKVEAFTQEVEKFKEPTPAPIDYRPEFAALNKQLSQLAERSVVKKPECKKCHEK